MNTQEHVSDWLKNYAVNANKKGYVIGVSGGIDSAVTSTLCAMTDLDVVCLLMPIHQKASQHNRGKNHIDWLMSKFKNVWWVDIPLTKIYDEFAWAMPQNVSDLALANSKARLRMTTLYAIATSNNLLVAGTGNKIEDFGIGFYTKGGDGTVDVSPIGSLTKTEVWQLGRDLGINQEIIDAKPTDGLWDDSRGDEDQIGATYPELEAAMNWLDKYDYSVQQDQVDRVNKGLYLLSNREVEVLNIFWEFRSKNRHKMESIPVCPHL